MLIVRAGATGALGVSSSAKPDNAATVDITSWRRFSSGSISGAGGVKTGGDGGAGGGWLFCGEASVPCDG